MKPEELDDLSAALRALAELADLVGDDARGIRIAVVGFVTKDNDTPVIMTAVDRPAPSERVARQAEANHTLKVLQNHLDNYFRDLKLAGD